MGKQNNKYNFSFTGFSLRLPETYKVAKARFFQEDVNWIEEIGNGKTTTTKIFLNEINKRLAVLTSEQKEVFIKGDIDIQKKIAFLAVCKCHTFIRDFMIEVVSEKYHLFDYTLTDGDYNSFFRKKMELHPELESLSDNSLKKIKQVTYKILEQSGIIDSVKKKNIQPQFVEDEVREVILKEDRTWLLIFMINDVDSEI